MTEQEKREKAIDYEMMAQTCDDYHSCGACPYNPEDLTKFIGERWKGGCPDYDRKLVYALGKGYRKEEEVRKETLQSLFSSVSSIVETTMKYISFESPIIHLNTLKLLIKQEFGVEVKE